MSVTKPPPAGWPRISSSLFSRDAALAIDWLCRAFGFEAKLVVKHDDGRIVHSQLELGGGLVMVAEETHGDRAWGRSPASVDGANTQAMMVFVDDCDAHCARARAAGAKIATEPKTNDHGEGYWIDRSYEAVDPDGHHWWFVERIKP
jgi:uncharacterized glyoxalase superfamily protein PhnB